MVFRRRVVVENPAVVQQRERRRLAQVEAAVHYLSTISVERIARVKYPERACCARARIFQLFELGLRPRDITRRQSGFVKRDTLYDYYEDFKILRAKRIIEFDRRLSEQRAKQGFA